MISDVRTPLVVTTAADAEVIRSVLDRAGFSERTLCEQLRLPALDSVDMPLFKSFRERLDGSGLRETLAALFLFGELVDASALGDLTESELSAFLAADLVRQWPAAEERRLYSPVRLVPIDGGRIRQRDLLVAGDRGDHPDGAPFAPFADIVFSGHNPLTRQFLRLLPQNPCNDLLDLCSGTGVGALMQADIAGQCTGVDVAERSNHFARFNAWLNGCDTLELCTGDLYRPLQGRRFDRIIAHPPYVPALTQKLTYRDAGQTGEEIVRGIVEGFPAHLAEDGTFHLLFLGMDTYDGTIEERARRWLGPAGAEFDIIYALDSRTPPELIATRLVDRAGGSPQDLSRWRDLFQGIRVQNFVYGALVGRRVPDRSRTQTFTRRVLLGEATTGASFERLFAWFDWLRTPGIEERVLAAAPTLSPDIHLEVRHQVENGTFVPEGYALSNAGEPFYAVVKIDPWVAALLSELDGTTTLREHHRRAAARERLPQGFTESDLARLMCFLGERGYVLI